MTEIDAWRASVADGANPRDIKFELALELVGRFHSPSQARQAQEAFVARFQRGVVPEDLPEVSLAPADPGGLPIGSLLKEAGLVKSTSEALRLIAQGAVRLDGERIEDGRRVCSVGSVHLVQVGKRRIARVRVAEPA
jgi:tyrosyl-tRNA synthetase